jgi:hypothetical protein
LKRLPRRSTLRVNSLGRGGKEEGSAGGTGRETGAHDSVFLPC